MNIAKPESFTTIVFNFNVTLLPLQKSLRLYGREEHHLHYAERRVYLCEGRVHHQVHLGSEVSCCYVSTSNKTIKCNKGTPIFESRIFSLSLKCLITSSLSASCGMENNVELDCISMLPSPVQILCCL